LGLKRFEKKRKRSLKKEPNPLPLPLSARVAQPHVPASLLPAHQPRAGPLPPPSSLSLTASLGPLVSPSSSLFSLTARPAPRVISTPFLRPPPSSVSQQSRRWPPPHASPASPSAFKPPSRCIEAPASLPCHQFLPFPLQSSFPLLNALKSPATAMAIDGHHFGRCPSSPPRPIKAHPRALRLLLRTPLAPPAPPPRPHRRWPSMKPGRRHCFDLRHRRFSMALLCDRSIIAR
jgi:hypothetical protein